MMNLFENLQLMKENEENNLIDYNMSKLKPIKNNDYKDVHEFPDGEVPLYAIGKNGTLTIGGCNIDENLINVTIHDGDEF